MVIIVALVVGYTLMFVFHAFAFIILAISLAIVAWNAARLISSRRLRRAILAGQPDSASDR